MSVVARQLDRPRVLVLRPLRGERLGGAVVGDGGCHQHDVDVGQSQGGVQHRIRGRRRDRLDAVRRVDGEVRGEEDHLGAAAARFGGERDAHAAGGPVAEVADGVERLSACRRR